MPQPLAEALDELRHHLTDAEHLVRAVAAGRRRGETTPRWSRAELRPVHLKGIRQLQVVLTAERPYTCNVTFTDPVIAELLAEPFGNWHVETTSETIQLRVTKKGEAQVSRQATAHRAVTAHDRVAEHLLAPDDPVYEVIGGNAAKRRQVDAFLRALNATLSDTRPQRIVDLGCGNAYLTFAAYRFLTTREIDAELIGVDVRTDQRDRNTALAAQLGWADRVRFVAGTILDAPVDSADVVLALHACDTATDEAVARAIGWQAKHVLVAPCCHHDLAAQLKQVKHSSPLVGQPILRERFADLLTDTLRALLLRQYGYRAELSEFVDSVHTPRNLLIRATRTGAHSGSAEYRQLIDEWNITPRLQTLLELAD